VRIVEALGTLAPVSRTAVLTALAPAAIDKDPAVRMATTRVVWGIRSVHADGPQRPQPGGGFVIPPARALPARAVG